MKIGIVAGETSGDILGAGLIRTLKTFYPAATYTGIGGEKMQAAGLHSLFPLERLAVMGFVEPLKRLPELLSIRKQLYRYFVDHQFDVVIGIDSPGFNTTLEYKLKQAGITTVHYVSPSVWAWRQGRIKKIARSVDLMLTLLPFETDIYQQHNVPVKFVGHPLADQFPYTHDQAKAQSRLWALLDQQTVTCKKVTHKKVTYQKAAPLLACLPGSRGGEVSLIGPVFWEAIRHCCAKVKDLQIIVPAANQQRAQQIIAQLDAYADLPITVIDGHSHEVMAAADAVLLASGTTALEAMLLKKPMVVVYKMATLSYWIISSLLKTPYVSLPNLLANKPLVPELIQADATVDAVTRHVLQKLESVSDQQAMVEAFTALHKQIKADASHTAATAIYQLLENNQAAHCQTINLNKSVGS